MNQDKFDRFIKALHDKFISTPYAKAEIQYSWGSIRILVNGNCYCPLTFIVDKPNVIQTFEGAKLFEFTNEECREIVKAVDWPTTIYGDLRIKIMEALCLK